MAEFFEAKGNPQAPLLRVVSRVRNNYGSATEPNNLTACQVCRDETGIPFPDLCLRIGWNITALEMEESGCHGLIELFVRFVLKVIQQHWCCSEWNVDDCDNLPFADITVVVPACHEDGCGSYPPNLSPHNFITKSRSLGNEAVRACTSGTSQCDDASSARRMLRRIRRRMLRRSSNKDLRMIGRSSDQNLESASTSDSYEICDRFDIMTDAHLSDVLELVAALPSTAVDKVEIHFSTSLYPTICHLHDDGLTRRLAQVKCTGRHIFDSTTVSLRRSFRRMRDHIVPGADAGALDSSDDEAEGSRIRRGWRTFTRAVRLPEIGRLIRTGLYSPRYLEHQISEVLDSLRVSIARGFALTQF